MPEEMNGTKLEIFERAADLFAQASYPMVSMRQIADAVGIKASSIYNHFESKDALLVAIYDYFDSQMTRLQPNLNELLRLAETEHPYDVLRRTTTVFPDDIRPLMAKTMLITASMARFDERADKLLHKNLAEMSFEIDCPLLEKMVALGRIEPLDIQSFALIHSSYSYSSAVRFYSDHMVDTKTWMAGLEMIFSIVKVKGEN